MTPAKQEKLTKWYRGWQTFSSIVITAFIVPLFFNGIRLYTEFIVVKTEVVALKKENKDLKDGVAKLKQDVTLSIDVEKLDRINDINRVQNNVDDFKKEYHADFPTNYLKFINK